MKKLAYDTLLPAPGENLLYIGPSKSDHDLTNGQYYKVIRGNYEIKCFDMVLVLNDYSVSIYVPLTLFDYIK